MAKITGLRKNFNDLPRKSNAWLIDNKPENKLSGGFYDQQQISSRQIKAYDPYFAVIYVLEGCGEYTDYLGRHFNLVPGAVVVRHPGTSFVTFKKPNNSGSWLEFAAALPTSFYSTMAAAHILDAEMTYLTPGISQELIELGDNYIDSLNSADTPIGRLEAYNAFIQFFATVLRLHQDHGQADLMVLKSKLNRARLILSDHLDQPLKMEVVARKLGMSYETFRKRFTQHCGLTPNEYRIRRRLDKADSLILHTHLSIKEIAFRLGYSAVSAFTRQYTAFRHYPPSKNRDTATKTDRELSL